jgi:hypothetical protein
MWLSELMLTLCKGLDLISALLKGLDPGQSGEKKGERGMEPRCSVETTKVIQGRNHATGERVPCLLASKMEGSYRLTSLSARPLQGSLFSLTPFRQLHKAVTE